MSDPSAARAVWYNKRYCLACAGVGCVAYLQHRNSCAVEPMPTMAGRIDRARGPGVALTVTVVYARGVAPAVPPARKPCRLGPGRALHMSATIYATIISIPRSQLRHGDLTGLPSRSLICCPSLCFSCLGLPRGQHN